MPCPKLTAMTDAFAVMGIPRSLTITDESLRDAFREETSAFVSLAVGADGNACPPDSALESLRIAIACEESVARGGPVRVAEIDPGEY